MAFIAIHSTRLGPAFGGIRRWEYATTEAAVTDALDLAQAMARASTVVDARVVAVPIPIAEAAVDVDKIDDLELVRRILAERSHSANR